MADAPVSGLTPGCRAHSSSIQSACLRLQRARVLVARANGGFPRRLADRARAFAARFSIDVDVLGAGAARPVIFGRGALAAQFRHVVRDCVVSFIVKRRLADCRLIARVGRVVTFDVSGRRAVLIGERPIRAAKLDVFDIGTVAARIGTRGCQRRRGSECQGQPGAREEDKAGQTVHCGVLPLLVGLPSAQSAKSNDRVGLRQPGQARLSPP